MHNNVVQAARQTFAGLGWGTLRFNFRSAGASGGHPAQGQKDASDLIAVSEFLRARSPGPIDFAAYSYGAWATMEAIRMGLGPDSLILISPPLDFISFEGLRLPDAPTLVTLGNQDEFLLRRVPEKLAFQPTGCQADPGSIFPRGPFLLGAPSGTFQQK